MKHLIHLLSLLLIVCFSGFAQKTDSLQRALKTADDTSRVIILNRLSQIYSNAKPTKSKKNDKADKAFDMATEALKLAEQLQFKKGIALSNYNLGTFYLKKKNYREAELSFLNSVELAKEVKDHDLVLKNFSYISKFNQELGNHSNAIAYSNMKSLYKDIMIKEANDAKNKAIDEKEKALEELESLKSTVDQKEAKLKETKQLLAKKPEIETVVEYKETTDYKLIGVLSFLIALMAVAIAWLLFSNRKQNNSPRKTRSAVSDTDKHVRELPGKNEASEKERSSIERSKLRLNSEIANLSTENQQKEMNLKTGQLLNQAYYIVQKNELLLKLKQEFLGLKESRLEELSKRIAEIDNKIIEHYDIKKDWADFQNYFESAFPEFLPKLSKKFPDLSNLDIKLLTMHKVNLTTYEMSSILHMKENELETAFKELNNKIKGPATT